LKKGDLGGFLEGYKIPPDPPLEKGGIKTNFFIVFQQSKQAGADPHNVLYLK
jgi:hypothetical protein